jgi:hypothetical protein
MESGAEICDDLTYLLKLLSRGVVGSLGEILPPSLTLLSLSYAFFKVVCGGSMSVDTRSTVNF